jgi:GNAT superfamily N-acetyltransferase
VTRTIRTLDLSGIQTLLDWAAEEGWNPGLADAKAFHAADPEGFIGAFVGDTMVAGISAVAYSDRYGFIGLYICHPAFRGQGHGRAVWQAAMNRLVNRTVGLDGMPEQQANYRSMGFEPAYETIRMSGVLPLRPQMGQTRSAHLSDVLELDREAFGADRSNFLEHWLSPPNTAVVSGKGYATYRPCRSGAKIGPIVGEDLQTAITLLGAFAGPVQIDVPTSQSEFIAHLDSLGFYPSFSTSRMYRGNPLPLHPKLYSPASLELG